MISVIETRERARLMPATPARKSFCACTMSAASMKNSGSPALTASPGLAISRVTRPA
jgi:hypothetical protein